MRRYLSIELLSERHMATCDLAPAFEFCPGDANRDNQFDSADLVAVFQAGEYEDKIVGNSTWATGDWDGDGEFRSSDLVLAFQLGGYERAEVLYPDVLEASLQETASRVFRVTVTLSSTYDTPDRYADAWRVLAPDGTVLGVRILTHDHQNEQPFTRSLSGVEIPQGIDEVTIQGRDQISGWGGQTVSVAVPG